MSKERILEDTQALIDFGWRNVAEDFLLAGGVLKRGDTVEGVGLAEAVMMGELGLKSLNVMATRASKLDADATKTLGNIFGDGIDEFDKLEAVSRRIAHHAGRNALSNVGSEFLRTNYRFRHSQTLASRDAVRWQAAKLGIGMFDMTRIRIVR
ncbi:MAG: hypothetical protein NTX11_04305 [Candidatus Saccharibacteria bacterium]|nr:hypothetical protein [Candidatus Saccharibacteria bacterium]